MTKYKHSISANEQVIRTGGNQTGSYVIICTGRNHWRSWNSPRRQSYMHPCNCALRQAIENQLKD